MSKLLFDYMDGGAGKSRTFTADMLEAYRAAVREVAEEAARAKASKLSRVCLIAQAKARKRAEQLRSSMRAEQRRWESRRDAMEVRYAGRLLDRRGSTEDRMSSWKTTIDRFLKLFCGNLVIATISAG